MCLRNFIKKYKRTEWLFKYILKKYGKMWNSWVCKENISANLKTHLWRNDGFSEGALEVVGGDPFVRLTC